MTLGFCYARNYISKKTVVLCFPVLVSDLSPFIPAWKEIPVGAHLSDLGDIIPLHLSLGSRVLVDSLAY